MSDTVSIKGYPLSTIPGYYASAPGIQIGTGLSPDASDEDIQFVKQLGVEWVMTSLPLDQQTVQDYAALRNKFASHGLRIYRLANHSCHNMEEVTLNLPGRDAKIEEYLNYIRNLGAAGIHYSTYAHMGNGIEHRPRGDPRRRPVARLSCRGGERRPLGGPGLARPTDPRPRIF
ncbi:MAG: hypothetical protein FJZ90_17045, partial [Chloroflexi bacterium]|nr:hypothetical protein [Chloroflexota bacterium]